MSQKKSVKVSVMGMELTIQCPHDQVSELQESARRLDKKMQLVRQNNRVLSTEKVAILAALNMTCETMTDPEDSQCIQQELLVWVNGLQNKLSQALEIQKLNGV